MKSMVSMRLQTEARNTTEFWDWVRNKMIAVYGVHISKQRNYFIQKQHRFHITPHIKITTTEYLLLIFSVVQMYQSPELAVSIPSSCYTMILVHCSSYTGNLLQTDPNLRKKTYPFPPNPTSYWGHPPH